MTAAKPKTRRQAAVTTIAKCTQAIAAEHAARDDAVRIARAEWRSRAVPQQP